MVLFFSQNACGRDPRFLERPNKTGHYPREVSFCTRKIAPMDANSLLESIGPQVPNGKDRLPAHTRRTGGVAWCRPVVNPTELRCFEAGSAAMNPSRPGHYFGVIDKSGLIGRKWLRVTANGFVLGTDFPHEIVIRVDASYEHSCA
jgi:hypothetical protein